jgi:hypothetical protein
MHQALPQDHACSREPEANRTTPQESCTLFKQENGEFTHQQNLQLKWKQSIASHICWAWAQV